jgi:hypothetical protein
MPPLANSFIFVEPDDNYLNYGSDVLSSLVSANNKSGQTIVEIKGVDANPDKVKSEISTVNPMVFMGIGHGNYTTYTVEAEQVFMQVGNPNVALMLGRIVHLNSCETAAQLGPAIISAGALAYLGSNEDFNFCIRDPPNTTRAVQTVFLAEYQFDVSLLNGKSVGDARTEQLAKYDSEVAYWISGAGNTDPDASDLANMLLGNKSISTFLGSSVARPSPATATPAQAQVSMIFALEAIVLAYGIYKTLRA